MALNPVLALAFGLAAETGSDHVSEGHLLLAVLVDESTVASRVLRGLGVSRAIVSRLLKLDPKPEAARSPHAVVTPAVHGVIGMARGFALAQGAPDAMRRHVLLALIYGDSGLMPSAWDRLGVNPAES